MDADFPFVKDIDAALDTELEDFYEKCNNVLKRKRVVNLPDELCLQSMTLLKALTQNSYDFDNLQMQDIKRKRFFICDNEGEYSIYCYQAIC